MDVAKAHSIITQSYTLNHGKFYSSGSGLNLGVGKIYNNVRYPHFSEHSNIFQTLRGMVYILTHECDVDQANKRPFNELLIVCPILKFENFCQQFQAELDESTFISLMYRIARQEVSRVIYIPPYQNQLAYGGFLYLNHMTSTHVQAFQIDNVDEVCAVTAYGLQSIDFALRNHLFRPKSEFLAFSNT